MQQQQLDERRVHATKTLAKIVSSGQCKETHADFTNVVISDSTRRMCTRCPLYDECKEYALEFEQYNFWAGMTEDERRKERRVRHIKLIDVFAPPT
jgi:hypothetical protein